MGLHSTLVTISATIRLRHDLFLMLSIIVEFNLSCFHRTLIFMYQPQLFAMLTRLDAFAVPNTCIRIPCTFL